MVCVPFDRGPSCQTLSTAGAKSFRVSPSIRFGVHIIPKKQKQEQNIGRTFKVHRKNARKDPIEKAHLNQRRRANSDGPHYEPPQAGTERREALNEIERLERPKQMKSEREAKLLVAALERPGHPAFAANVAPSISDGLIGTPTPRSKS